MTHDNRPYLYNSTFKQPREGLKKVNHERRARLREKQFGTDGKREWIMGMLCGVTGQEGTEEFPIDPCHVGSPDPDVRGQSTRGAGADDTFLFPMRREVHRAFDSLDAQRFEEVFGVSKQWVREMAVSLHEDWLVRCAAERDDTTDESEE